MSTVVLTVVAAKVAGSETNFPVLITPSVITGLGSISLGDAQSSRIYADVTKLVEQAREVVSADEIHTKIAALTTLSECYFDYDGIRSDYSVTDTYGRNAVWSGHVAKYNLQDANDSSGNGYTLTPVLSPTYGTAKIGNGVDFGTSATGLKYTTDNMGVAYTSSITMSGWFKLRDNTKESYFLFKTNTGNPGAEIQATYQLSPKRIRFLRYAGVTANSSYNVAPTNGTWFHVAVTFDGSTLVGYYNGTAVTSASTSGSTNQGGTTHFALGLYGLVSYNPNGMADDVRVTNTNRSANWITTEYNNQNDNAAFWTASAGGGSTYRFVPQLRPFGGL